MPDPEKIIEGLSQFNMKAYAISLVAWWPYGSVLESVASHSRQDGFGNQRHR